MTLEEIRLKYRRHLLGLASSLVVDTPAVILRLSDGERVTDARGNRVECLEQLGKDIDKAIDAIVRDALNLPAKEKTSEQPTNDGGGFKAGAPAGHGGRSGHSDRRPSIQNGRADGPQPIASPHKAGS